jgi:uncharacterized protein YdeI (BOF family)
MNFVPAALTLALLATLVSGCNSKQKILGKAPKAPVATILAINAGDAPSTVSIEGTMVEKCPQAGCWFKISDGTGVIKVDTKAAGFVVTQVPLNAKVKVAGKIETVEEEAQLRATGLSY